MKCLPYLLCAVYDVLMREDNSYHTLVKPRAACCFLTMAALFVFTLHQSLLMAQTRELGRDVNKLNIRHRTTHYELAGTVRQEKLIEYGRCLEFIHAEYEKGFGDLFDPSTTGTDSQSSKKEAVVTEKKTDSKSLFRVVILGSKRDYREFTRAYFGQFAEHTAGMFIPGVELLIILDEGHAEQTYQVLFHEALHQFVHRYFPAAPVWLNEGLASHFGTARVFDKGLVFDRRNTSYFNIVRNVAQAKRLIALDKLVLMSRADFYSQERLPGLNYSQRTLSYAEAYTLTSYMVNTPNMKVILRNYIRALALATTPCEVRDISKTFYSKHELDSLASQWLAFVYQEH